MGDNKHAVSKANVATPTKRTGRGGKYNFPSSVDPATENPEDIKRAASSVMYWYNRGEDKPRKAEEVRERIGEFFSTCISSGQRPTVEKLALALGTTSKKLWDWQQATDERGEIIKKAKEFLAAFDADLAVSGKMNPVPYIFRAKNYYGMKDQQDLVIEPKQGIVDQSAEDVASRYAELPED